MKFGLNKDEETSREIYNQIKELYFKEIKKLKNKLKQC